MTLWVNRETNETIYEPPTPPPYPLMPGSLTDKITGKPLSPAAIQQNEADSSSEDESVDTRQSDGSDGSANSKVDDVPPLGVRDAELELAKKRVLERRIQLYVGSANT